MTHQKLSPQGIYAGLAPAILMMGERGPAFDAKSKTAMLLAEAAEYTGDDRRFANFFRPRQSVRTR